MTATTRTLVAAFAAATLAAPSALAQPIDPPLRDAQAQAALPGPPAWPKHAQAISAPRAPVAQSDGGIDAATIGLGAAGSILAIGAIAGVANRSLRPRRRGATV